MILDTPAFFLFAPADNLNFKTVVLNVNASGQHQHFFRHFAIILFTALVEVVRFELFALFLPCLPHLCVGPDFEKFNIAFLLFVVCGKELLHNFPPFDEQGSKGVQVKAPNLSFRVLRNKPPAGKVFFPFRFGG